MTFWRVGEEEGECDASASGREKSFEAMKRRGRGYRRKRVRVAERPSRRSCLGGRGRSGMRGRLAGCALLSASLSAATAATSTAPRSAASGTTERSSSSLSAVLPVRPRRPALASRATLRTLTFKRASPLAVEAAASTSATAAATVRTSSSCTTRAALGARATRLASRDKAVRRGRRRHLLLLGGGSERSSLGAARRNRDDGNGRGELGKVRKAAFVLGSPVERLRLRRGGRGGKVGVAVRRGSRGDVCGLGSRGGGSRGRRSLRLAELFGPILDLFLGRRGRGSSLLNLRRLEERGSRRRMNLLGRAVDEGDDRVGGTSGLLVRGDESGVLLRDLGLRRCSHAVQELLNASESDAQLLKDHLVPALCDLGELLDGIVATTEQRSVGELGVEVADSSDVVFGGVGKGGGESGRSKGRLGVEETEEVQELEEENELGLRFVLRIARPSVQNK